MLVTLHDGTVLIKGRSLSDLSIDHFYTGSRVYGIPRPDSDTDICVLLNSQQFSTLYELSEGSDEGSGQHSQSLRFGVFNLICMIHPGELWKYLAWKEATQRLTARRPVTREEAIEEIDLLELDYAKAAAETRQCENGLIYLSQSITL